MAQIDSTLSGPERKAALCALLEKETQLIASIGRHRIFAGEKNQSKAVEAFLDKVCCHPLSSIYKIILALVLFSPIIQSLQKL